MKVVTTAEMRRIERAADAGGLSYAAMMENAGRSVAEIVQEETAWFQSGPILALCGPGNNGGDGLVAARYLARWGHAVRAYCVKRDLTGDENRERAIQAGVELCDEADDADHARLRAWLSETGVVVDALLGTGATLPVRDPIRSILMLAQEAVRTRRAQPRLPVAEELPRPSPVFSIPPAPETGPTAPSPQPQVVAVDCPSGLDCDTGALDPAALPADVTVTFAYPKVGHFLFPGAGALGRLLVADIGVPPALADDVTVELAMPAMARALLPARPPNAHKGTFGRALVVAGSVNYTGAAYLAGAAATRVGTGLVTMAVPGSLHPILAAALHETVWLLLPHDMGVIAPDAWRMLDERLADHQALLIGPGLSQEKEAVTFVQDFLLGGRAARRERGHIGFLPQTESSRDERKDRPSLPPAVIDADALNALARLVEDAPWPDRQPVPSADSGQALWPLACRPGQAGTGDRRQGNDWSGSLPRPCVLTPHPGEMARLCRLSTQEVNADRLGLARGRAAEWEQVVLLKGAYTVVAAPDGRAVILPFANPGLASGGTGDVLAGAIVGLLAQGVAPFAAAVLGGYVHGLAGELARQTLGEAGMVAGDLLPQLPEAMRRLAAS